MSTELVDCEGHGQQPAAFACTHLVVSEEPATGFHWNCDDGDLIANCDACEAKTGDDGFLPDAYFTENFVVICRLCFIDMASDNGVDPSEITAAEAAAQAKVA